jgi:hypothetical protein
MIDQPYILLIMNCKKYIKKALFQKRTWIHSLPDYIKYYHVIGDETLEKDYIFDNINHVLFVKTMDDYNSLPKKVIAAYNAVNSEFDYKYIFKTDDDQILVKKAFFDIVTKLVSTFVPKTHYGGYIVDVKSPHLSQYHKIHPELPENLPVMATKYCSGRFYYLSKEAIVHLINIRDKIEKEYFEDYAIGYNLPIELKQGMVHIATNKFFTDIELSDFPKLVEQNKI